MGVYGVFESCESVIVVCEYGGSVIDVCGVLKNSGSVIVVCNYGV